MFGAGSRFAAQPLGFVCAIAIVLLWGGWYVISRWAVTGSLTPGDLMLIRYVTAALAAWPLLLSWRRRRGPEPLPWRALAVMVPAYGLVYPLALYYGLILAPVANAGVLLNGLLPVASGLLAWLLYRQRIGGGKWGAMLLLAAANGCMLAAGAQDASLSAGWLLVLLSMGGMATYMCLYQRNALDFRLMIPLITYGNLLLFLPIAPFLKSNLAEAPLGEILFQAVFQGLVIQIAVIYLINQAVARLGSVPTAMLFGFVPATAALLGWALLGEALVALELVGVLGCTAGIILFARAR